MSFHHLNPPYAAEAGKSFERCVVGERNCSADHPFTVDAENGIVYGVRGKPLHKTCSSGYILAMYGPHSARRYLRAHVIVWESVHGPITPGLVINHINGVKTDNRIANLEMVTESENLRHAFRTGLTSRAGAKNNRAKLTADKVREIRNATENKRTTAVRYGVCEKTIQDIRNGHTWTCVA